MCAIRKKLVIIGEVGCGKTSLITVFCKDQFPVVYIPKLFGSYIADIEIDGKEIELVPEDTVSDVKYSHLRPQSYPSTDVILMCFSLDSVDSFDSITKTFSPEVQRFCPNVPIVLVGTKRDLRTENFNPITREEGILLAEKIKACAYLECSAKHKVGVREVFELATRVAMIEKRHKWKRILLAVKKRIARSVRFVINELCFYFEFCILCAPILCVVFFNPSKLYCSQFFEESELGICDKAN